MRQGGISTPAYWSVLLFDVSWKRLCRNCPRTAAAAAAALLRLTTWARVHAALSTPAADNKSHSCVCGLWSLSASGFQRVLVSSVSVTYGEASSHSPTWLILPSPALPLPCTDDITRHGATKLPERLSFTVKHVARPCRPVQPKYCVLLVKEGSRERRGRSYLQASVSNEVFMLLAAFPRLSRAERPG